MGKCTIDGKTVEFQPGTNLIEVARTAGIEIPYFCYHPALSVVAQCRMCAVEIEGMAKLQTACSTPATEGMVVKTRSDRARANQKSVMEFLLINHPLDCSICDKSGECDLQDLSYKYGSDKMRYEEHRRTFIDDDMGPVIKKNMNRCIHCTRCIRFGAEITKIPEIVAVQRGNHTEIVTVEGKPLETEYAGNYSDICPTGSLTLKDFRFQKRVWYLTKTPTICEGCSRGCNMDLWWEKDSIYRCTPRVNMEINKWWLCDEGRFNFHYVNDAQRVVTPRTRLAGDLKETDWLGGLQKAVELLKGKKPLLLVGSDLIQEELKAVQEFGAKAFPGAPIQHFGTPGVVRASDDTDIDSLLKRKSKTSNLHGAEKLGISGFTTVPQGVNAVLLFRGGRATIPAVDLPVVAIGVFKSDEVKKFDVILPATSFAEKTGTIVNAQGKEQKLQATIPPVGMSKPVSEILARWAHGHTTSPSEGTSRQTSREAANV